MVVDMSSKGRDGTILGTAVVTGASSGIGAATARGLAAAGFEVVLGARRLDRLEAVAAELPGARALPLDVTDASSVESFCGQVPSCRVLVNNAGGALGLEPIAEADEEKWREMWESNVLGTLRMTRGLLGKLIASGDGLVVNVCSVAAFEPYPGGAGYNAAKAAERALTDVLRMELLGRPVRVTEIDPGMVRRTSPWSASGATRLVRRRSTRASSRSALRTSLTASPSSRPGRATSTSTSS